jgi:hypothetical protein
LTKLRTSDLLSIAVRRARSDAGMMLAVAAGVAIAAVALGGVVTYLRSLELVAVNSTVDGLGSVRKNVQVVHRRIPFTAAGFEERDVKIEAAAARHLSAIDAGHGHYIRSPFYMWGFAGTEEGIRRLDEDPQALFESMANLDAHVRYTDGAAPGDGVKFDGRVPVVEASLVARRARQFDVRVGDVIELEAFGDSRGRVTAVVTGLFEAVDIRASFWNGLGDAVLAPEFDNRPPVLPLLVQEHALWAVASATPGAVAEATWIIQTDSGVLRGMTPTQIRSTYAAFRSEVEVQVPRSTVFSGLEPSFRDLERRVLFARVPMFLIGALLLAVVAYYMFMVAGMLADRRGGDIAKLRGRGVSAMQIARMYVLEGAAIVGIAAIAAPFLARVVVAQLGRLPIYEPVTGGGPLPTELSVTSFGWAALAGIGVLAILAIPAVLHARTDLAGASRSSSRPARWLWFQRYYLDAVVLVLGGLVLWELRTRRTIVTSGLEGQPAADITMLFAPALLLVGVTLAFLRVYPPVLRLIAWGSARVTPVWIAIPLWRLSRNPFQYAWPMLLLVLAAGLAVLAAALGSTLERSSFDRSAYATGADVHASSVRVSGFAADTTMASVRAVPGVQDAALAVRLRGDIGTTGRGGTFELLAVEAERLGRISWFREDFADRPLQELLGSLPSPADPPPITLPQGATHIAMWTRSQPAVPRLFLWVVLRDGSGQLHTVTLGPVEGGSWRQQTTALPQLIHPPLEVVSILTFEPVQGDEGSPAVLFLDDLVALQGDQGVATVLFDFDSRELWSPLPTSQGFDLEFDLVSEDFDGPGPHRGASVARLLLGRGTDSGVRGIYRSATVSPIPILASEGFLSRNSMYVGDRFVGSLGSVLAPLVIVDSVRLFPTMDPGGEGFVIADLKTVLWYAEMRGIATGIARDSEIFVAVDPSRHGAAVDAVRAAIGFGALVNDRASLQRSYLIDPLTVAGWRGVGLVATLATLGIVTLGLVTYLSAHFARTKVESGFLRALGLARGAQVGATAVEQISITMMGLALGTATGVAMTRVAVDAVSHTESGRPVLPPFTVVMEWQPLALVFGGLTVVAIVALGRLSFEYVRLPLHALTRRDG